MMAGRFSTMHHHHHHYLEGIKFYYHYAKTIENKRIIAEDDAKPEADTQTGARGKCRSAQLVAFKAAKDPSGFQAQGLSLP